MYEQVGYDSTGGSPLFTCSHGGNWVASNSVDNLKCAAIQGFCVGNPLDESGLGQNIVLTDDVEKCDRKLGTVCEATCANGTTQVAQSDPSYT